MIKTGIYGGSFNPVHHGHLQLARTLLREAGLDEVWFMVSPQNPLKQQSELLDDDKRLELVRLALQGEPGLVACDYEFHLPRPSYTYDTLSAMRRDFPDCSFTLLIGADNWADFQHWYKHDAILAEYPIMVYPHRRDDFAAPRAAVANPINQHQQYGHQASYPGRTVYRPPGSPSRERLDRAGATVCRASLMHSA